MPKFPLPANASTAGLPREVRVQNAMPQKPKPPLPAPVSAEIPQRLHDTAEAFYFAAILSSTEFYGGGAAPNQHSTVDRARDGILNRSNRRNHVDAPPL